MFGLRLGKMGAAIRSALAAWSPSYIFANSEQGAWYDPSDMSTLYQDAAGTTPVTAVEQPVGLMLDKSGNGNHASQATSTARPVLSARVNLLTKTEDFGDSGGWVFVGIATPIMNQVGYYGGLTASNIIPSAESGQHQIALFGDGSGGVGPGASAYRYSWIVKSGGCNYAAIRAYDGTSYFMDVTFNLSTGLVDSTRAGAGYIESLGNGWFQISTTGTSVAKVAQSYSGLWPRFTGGITAEAGNSVDGIIVCAPMLKTGSTALPYQRVNTASDYDAVGFPKLANYDSVDDVMNTTFASALGSNCTVARAVVGGPPVILTGQTIGTSFADTTDHAGLIIIDRALTAGETASLTEYLTAKGAS